MYWAPLEVLLSHDPETPREMPRLCHRMSCHTTLTAEVRLGIPTGEPRHLWDTGVYKVFFPIEIDLHVVIKEEYGEIMCSFPSFPPVWLLAKLGQYHRQEIDSDVWGLQVEQKQIGESLQLRVPTWVGPSDQREHLRDLLPDGFFLGWNSCLHRDRHMTWTENEILLSVEGTASASESVSFLLPGVAFHWARDWSLSCSHDCSWNLGRGEVSLIYGFFNSPGEIYLPSLWASTVSYCFLPNSDVVWSDLF